MAARRTGEFRPPPAGATQGVLDRHRRSHHQPRGGRGLLRRRPRRPGVVPGPPVRRRLARGDEPRARHLQHATGVPDGRRPRVAAYLARTRPYAAATRTAANVGKVFALLFVFVGVFVAFSPILLLLALFIYTAASSESRAVVIGDLLSGVAVRDVALLDRPTVSADASVADLFDLMLRERQVAFPVTESDIATALQFRRESDAARLPADRNEPW